MMIASPKRMKNVYLGMNSRILVVGIKPGVYFTNNLQAAFSCKSVLHNFSLITVWLLLFFGKRIFAQKLLIKEWFN